MNKKPLREEVVKLAGRRGRRMTLTCMKAHSLADKLGMSPGMIGKICDEAGIKLVNCRLGCF